MKKQNKNNSIKTILLLLIVFICISCIDKEGEKIYYQISNEVGESLKIRFYDSSGKFNYDPDSIVLKSGENSEVFYEIKGGANEVATFIFYVDSIDIINNKNELLRRYLRKDELGKCTEKSLYCPESFTKITTNNSGQTVHVYSILATDFSK